jgi:hypothetical protein
VDHVPESINFTVEDPMIIVSDETGAMRLRDMLLLSSERKIVVSVSSLFTSYTPTDTLKSYYQKALERAVQHGRAVIDTQIKTAIREMADKNREDQEYEAKLADMILSISGVTVH